MASRSPSPLVAAAAADARKYGLPANVFVRQIRQESGFDPNAKSPAGAEGIAQFIPSTAREYGLTDPYNPTAALDAAARYDADLLKRYGTMQRALSAYNSGRPDAYKDPQFAGGQTFNYVRSILGGTQAGGGGASPSPRAAAAAPDVAPDATPDARAVFARQLLGAISPTGQLDNGGLVQALQARRRTLDSGFAAPAAAPALLQAAQHGGNLALAAVPTRFDTRPGITVDRQILPAVEQIAQRFGVRVNSGYRSPSHNQAVGGAQGSDHLTGDAVDFTGTPAQMAALYAWATRQHLPYVEPMAQAKNHVHISFARTGSR